MLDRFKTWLKASPAPVVVPEPPVEQTVQRESMRISDASLARAKARSVPSAPDPLRRAPEEIYKPYAYASSVVPAEMAMDHGLPTTPGSLANWASSALFHEGQGFFGFPLLAELLQRAEYRHACEIWAEHIVRKWIKITGGTTEQRKAVEAEFDRLDVRTVVETWAYHDQAFGRGQIFLDFGDADNMPELAAPLRLVDTKISPRRPLQALKAVEPVWSAPGVYETSNPLKPDFYKPRDWIVYGKRVHHSRMLTMTSRPLSDMLKPAYAFAGLSLVQMMKPYVDNWLRTRQAVSDMVNSYSILNLKTDMSATLAGGDCSDIYKRAELANDTRDNRGMWLTDKESEELENIAVPLSGLHELQQQAQEQLASVARIPLSVYLQITPTGLSTNSDGETRNFYADVHSLQEKNIRPGLRVILKAVQLSLFGERIDDMDFEFLPLWEMNDKDKAEMRKADADADIGYVSNGVISEEEVRERLSNDESSLYYGVDLTDPPPDQGNDGDGDENDGEFGNAAMDAWNEADHPRDKDGKFGTGGGSSGLKAFIDRPTVWTSRSSGLEYVANPLKQISAAAVRSQQEALEDALVEENSKFFETKMVDPNDLQSIQNQVARNQVASVAEAGSFNAESNGDLPLVIRGPEGLILIDGNHRASAAMVSGEKLKAQIFDYDAWQAAEAAKAEEKRKASRPSAKEIDDLAAALGLDKNA